MARGVLDTSTLILLQLGRLHGIDVLEVIDVPQPGR